MPARGMYGYNTLQRTATHYNTPQHAATHCNTLQHIQGNNPWIKGLDLDLSLQIACVNATHCTALQHTLKHRHTPQHTATHTGQQPVH